MLKKLLKIPFFSLIFWFPIIIFSKLAGEILEKEPIFLDIQILEFIHKFANANLDNFFLYFTEFGGFFGITIFTILICFYLYQKKYFRKLFIILTIIGGAGISNSILKLIFHRDRPSLWNPVIVENSYSFPSGHAMLSSALVFSIIFILWKTKYRIVAIIFGAIFIVLIGFSRVYLGVHYPTDILAGWCASLAWGLIVLIIFRRKLDD